MAKGPNYISAEGMAKLTGEFDQLVRVERPRVVNNVAAAAAEGDRSENAEYIYGKKRLREIDRRLRFLQGRIDAAEVVERAGPCDKVRFLHWVVIEDEEGDARTVRIVGQDETDADRGWISWKSPVGSALLNHGQDDEVSVQTPGGVSTWVVLEILAEAP